MSDLSKFLAKNQKEMLRLLAPNTKARDNHPDVENSDSETENVFPTNTLTPVKNRTTMRKNTPTVSSNNFTAPKNTRRDTHKSRKPFFPNWKQRKTHLSHFKKSRNIRKKISKLFEKILEEGLR